MTDVGPGIALPIIFVAFAAMFVLRGPLGKALAERLAGRPRADDAELLELRGEIEDVRRQLAEVHERLDFAERLVARHADAERALPPATR